MRNVFGATHAVSGGWRYRVIIPETENPQEARNILPGYPARYVKVDPGRYFTQCRFSRGTAQILIQVYIVQ